MGLFGKRPDRAAKGLRSDLVQTAFFYLRRYEQTQDADDLDHAITFYRHATTAAGPASVAVVYNLGSCLLKRFMQGRDVSDLNEGIQLFEEALALTPPGSAQRPAVLSGLSTGLGIRYRFTGDQQALESALEFAEESVCLTPPDVPDRAEALGSLALDLLYHHRRSQDLTELDRALQLADRALAMTPEHASRELSTMLDLLRMVHSERYEQTLDLADINRAIEIGRHVVEIAHDSALRSQYLSALAADLRARNQYTMITHLSMSDLEEAIQCQQQSAELAPPSSPIQADRLDQLASYLRDRCVLKEGNLAAIDEIIALSERALELARSGASRPAGFLANLGVTLVYRYRNGGAPADLDRAISSYAEALLLSPPGTRQHIGYLTSFGDALSEIHDRNGDPDDLRRATEAYREARVSGWRGSELNLVLSCAESWGESALKRSAWTEAAEAYRHGLMASERIQRNLRPRANEDSQLFYSQDLFVNAAYALARTGDCTSAIMVLEQGRTRLLASALARERAWHDSGRADLRDRYSDLEAAATFLDVIESFSPDDNDAGRRLRDDLAVQMKTISQEAVDLADDSAIPEFAHIQHVLTAPADETGQPAVSVYIALRPRGQAGMALIVHSGGVQPVWFEIALEPPRDLNGPFSDDIAKQYPFTRYLLAQFKEINRLRDALNDVLPLIGQKMMRPIASALNELLGPAQAGRGPHTVTIIPCGILSTFPLHAASYRSGGRSRILLEDYTVAYAPSARMLDHSQRVLAALPRRHPSLLAVGNPLPTTRQPLIYARLEAEVISSYFPDDLADVLCEANATLQSVENLLSSATYAHFACHGQFNAIAPRSSGMLLADDEMLTLADLLIRSSLGSKRLVVLSACQTAMADFLKLREEAVGLPAGFLQAGAPGVVGSLWPVDDLSTAFLMTRFYLQHLRGDPTQGDNPAPPARALRDAQLWLRDVTKVELGELLDTLEKAAKSPQTSTMCRHARLTLAHYAGEASDKPFRHPYYWAGFEFCGV